MRASACVGRVGATALALGVGLVFGGGAGLAWASPSDSGAASDNMDASGQEPSGSSAARTRAGRLPARVARAEVAPQPVDTVPVDGRRTRAPARPSERPLPTAAESNRDDPPIAVTAPASPKVFAQNGSAEVAAPLDISEPQIAARTPRPAAAVAPSALSAPKAATSTSAPTPAVVSIPATPATPVMSALAQPAAAAGAVEAVALGLLGTGPESPLGWGILAAARGEIGRYRRSGTPARAGAATATPATRPTTGPPTTPPPFAADEVLVGWKAGATAMGKAQAMTTVKASVVERLGTKQMLQTDQGTVYRLKVPGGTAGAIQALSKNPNVAFAEPNYRVTRSAAVATNDPYYTGGSLWGMNSDDAPTPYGPAGTTNAFGSGAEEAWGQGYTGSRNVVVAVLDEGIQITHPDLAANIWTNPGEVAGDSLDNDGNGYVDDVNGWDFVYNDNTVYHAGEDAHGTHVAGTIGAVGGNGVGVAGVNWNVGIIPLKFLGPQGGYTSDAVEALYYLVDTKTRTGANIVAVNNSWGGGGYSSALHGAILRAAKADILFVAAAGNSAVNTDSTANWPSNYSTLQATATESAANYESVISVASITSTGALSSFSNYGGTTVDLGAPGSGILSTVPSSTYASYNGTSMAAPHVTGALALYKSSSPGTNAAGLRTAILNNTKPTTALSGRTATGGRLSLEGLFSAVAAPPTVSIADARVVEGSSGTSNASFAVTLSQASASPVTVNYATANGSATAGTDYVAGSGTVTFAAGEVSKTVGVGVLGDSAVESDETFTVALSSPSGATLSRSVATGTIANDDVAAPPTVSIADARVVEGNSGTSNASFAVTLSQASASPVTVKYATANGSAAAGTDYVAGSGTVTFAAGEVSKTVGVGVLGDSAVESDETFTVALSGPSGATLSRSVATGTIANDDVVTPAVTYDPTVVSVSAPITSTRNRNNTVTVTVGNLGNTAVQASVSLSATGGTPGATRTVLVPAGGRVATNIAWKSPSSTGTYTLTATTRVVNTSLVDANPFNNTKSVNVTIR